MAGSFKDTLRALKNKKMLSLLLLGMSSGLPFALTLGTLQAWMKDSSIDIKTIGLFAFLRLPFSLKFLWSPLMDRYAFPFLDRRRGWALVTQALISISILGMAVTDPTSQIQQLLILTLLVNFFSASQDIVLDAYRREVLETSELGLGVGVFVNGYIIAFRYISGALALILPPYIGGWGNVYFVMAGMMALFAGATIFAPKITAEFKAPKSLSEAFFSPLKEYFSRPQAWTILAFIVLYKVGDTMAGTMSLPFILEQGFSKEEYVAIAKLWGPIATILGGLIGGHYVMKVGIQGSLWSLGILQGVSTAAFALLMLTGKSNLMLIAIIGFENMTAQMGTAAYAAYMASITNVQFTATQYALLSSLMAIPGAIFGSRTGGLAQSMGWTGFFILCSVVALPGLLLIPVLKERGKITGTKGIFVKIVITLTVGAGIYALTMSAWDILGLFIPGLKSS